MTYESALDFIHKSEKFGSVPGLENISNLMNEFDNIQDSLKIIHIAGTNGKGSVGTFISSILKMAGFKIGRYISPTITEYLERFQINNVFMSENSFSDICEKVQKAVNKIVDSGKPHPTAFEIETAIAFLYFYEENCDFVVLETGLGGKLDATNIIKKNVCCVLTSISLDHTNFLGNSLSEIAEEKCGIIKEKSKVISIEQNDDVMNVITKNCKDKNADVRFALKGDIKYDEFDEYFQCFDYKNYKNIKIQMLGLFQTENASLALETVELISELGYNISTENIYDGLFNASWQGRFQVLKKNPLFIIDGAHNEDAARRLKENIQLYFKNKNVIFIVGVFKDKDYKKIAEITGNLASKIFAFSLNGPRGLDSKILAQEFKKYNHCVEITENIYDAVNKSFSAVGNDGVIIAFGSLSYLGELIKLFEGDFINGFEKN